MPNSSLVRLHLENHETSVQTHGMRSVHLQSDPILSDTKELLPNALVSREVYSVPQNDPAIHHHRVFHDDHCI